MPLQDPADTTRHGAVFLLRNPPIMNAAISLDGWTTQVQNGINAVVTFGPGRASDAAGALSESHAAANNGLDYMSVRGSADVAIKIDSDDCLVWWPEGDSSVMQANVVWTTQFAMAAEGVVRDAAGNVQPSPPLNPVQHDAFRFIRMSRTSVYLYDSYRNIFLALESLLADIAPQQNEGEAVWFKRALSVADTLVPVAELAPPNEADPITWAYENIYRDQRSALMHAKRDYLLPQDESARQALTATLETVSNYVHKLVATHLRVNRREGHLADSFRRKMIENFLTAHKLYVSDDGSPFHGDDVTTLAPAAGSKVLEASPSQCTMLDRWYGTVTASWSAGELGAVDGVRRMGALPANGDPGGVVSELRGPLVFGASLARFEMHLGMRNFDACDPPRHFSA